MKILLVTTWDTACGIAEHSAMLKDAVERADSSIAIVPVPEALNPETMQTLDWVPDVLHLNYQGALHSRWSPEFIRAWQAEYPQIPVVVTYHDTGVPNSEQCKQIAYVLRPRRDMMVVHEPFDDLPIEKTRYWRMGVPDWQEPWRVDRSHGSWCGQRPILGTVGFPFGWKCYDELAKVTAQAGWALLLLAPRATSEDGQRWYGLNPHIEVHTRFLSRGEVISRLAGCDATAFTYVCHNTGQSGAILQGIAARKPVIALSTCRQMRALYDDSLGHTAINWNQTFEDVYLELTHYISIERVSPQIVALAEQESWARLGAKYAALYRELTP